MTKSRSKSTFALQPQARRPRVAGFLDTPFRNPFIDAKAEPMTSHAIPTTGQPALLGATRELSPLTTRIRAREDAVIADALAILKRRLHYGSVLDSTRAVREYLTVLLAQKPHEEFVVIFLDTRNRVIAVETLFRGTLMQTSVYPREVVKAALAHNAASILCAHNHPSGKCEPSRADQMLTAALQRALALVDINVLDHFIVAGTETDRKSVV